MISNQANSNINAYDYAQDQMKTAGVQTKRTTLTEIVGQAHEMVEQIQKLVTGLETRLTPILSFSSPDGQASACVASVEPSLIDEAGSLLLRLQSVASRIDDIERRTRI